MKISAFLFCLAAVFGVISSAASAQECDLCVAAGVGDTVKIAELIAAGADPDMEGPFGAPALLYAARHGQAEAIEALIFGGATWLASDDRGLTGTMVGVLAGHVNVVSVLMARGAPINQRDENGWTPLIYASQHGHVPLASLILSGVNTAFPDAGYVRPNRGGPDGMTPLMAAVAGNNREIVRMILDANADVNQKNDYGTTALMFAAYFGREEIAYMLLDTGAEVNAGDQDGRTAAMFAVSRRHEGAEYQRIFFDLINNRGGAEAQDNFGNTFSEYAGPVGSDLNPPGGVPLSPTLQRFNFTLRATP
ncbi:MAG: ankyrin repeat domain-containing protein [Gammaproteobacteria bacterium]